MRLSGLDMDPWKDTVSEQVVESQHEINSFEDNFKPTTVDDRLPDSDHYLFTLENKLSKLKSDPNILSQLHNRREECLRQLLSDSLVLRTDETHTLDTPVTESALLRSVLPHKQALTVGELVELLKSDQLQLQSEQETEESASR